MADEGLVDRLEGALIALRGEPARRQAELLVAMLPELGWQPAASHVVDHDLAIYRAGDFAEVRLRQGAEQLDVLERIQGPLERRSPVDVAREADVEGILEAFVGAEPTYRLKPARHLLEVRGEDAPREVWGWSFTDADGKGADCRLFCNADGQQWSWYPGSPGDDPQHHAFALYRCFACGKAPLEHLLVPAGTSACAITEGGHLAGDLCECTAWRGVDHDLGMPHGFDREGNVTDCPPNCPVVL